MVHQATLLLIATITIAAIHAAKEKKVEFEEFKKKHGRKYKDDLEESKRFEIFSKKLDKIEAHNKEFAAGKKSFKLGVNKATDMTDEEINLYLKGRKSPPQAGRTERSAMGETFRERPKRAIPPSFDWRLNGSVSPIKDQGYCGSCWSFSATGVLESHNFIKTKQMVLFSEQNLVDCVSNVSPYYSNGCDGGWEYGALRYIQNNNNNIAKEELYPYEEQKSTCRFKATNDGFTRTISSIVQTKAGNETDVMLTLATIGPVTAGIDTSGDFPYYEGGVYENPTCSSSNLDHAVLIVGYGTDPLYGDYWLVKNSWGTWWGEQGYVRIARNKGNMCGIATDNYYPKLA